jgi:hypothetical protein
MNGEVENFARYLADANPEERERAMRQARMRAAILIPGDELPEVGLLSKRVDLGRLMRDGIPPVEYMPGEFARRMVYAEGVTGFSGHPESGKTTLVCRLALDAMRHGRHVVYFDGENGENEAARRFLALGATDDLLSEYLIYLPFTGAPDWTEIEGVWDEFPGAVAVWDSLRGILRTLGINEDKASEVATFMDPLVEFSLTRKIPSLLIDHVTKAANAGSNYSRGSGDKLAAVQAQWYVDRVSPFSEIESGEIELHRWKARSGALLRSHRFAVGDGEGKLTFRKLDADETPEGKIDRKIIETLRDNIGVLHSLRDLEAAVEGTAAVVRERVRVLAEDPQRPVRADHSGQHVRYGYDPEADHEPAQPLAL